MAETIFQILQWAVPSGGIGAAIAWIANRRLRTVEEKKKVEDTYKQMYDMVSAELVGLQKQNRMNYEKIEGLRNESDKTRRALNRLSRAVEAIQLCPHRAACPVSSELSLDEETDGRKAQRTKYGRIGRQRVGNHQRDTDAAAEGTDVGSEPDAQAGLVEPAASRRRILGASGTGESESTTKASSRR
ncbi:hypothetical protein [Prevotella multiformis]|uniref:Uncharacterized protein n=1 Tax=Prevotella multiformis DSM 16608 TaxID=888743 RepID=F0FB54_9BACT|nr:hypothetical protein [Prevotella multiformis]EGC18622.1 hypothetical protein HMPREF9141_2821 [Prevotella multiformis DSM 16608]